MERHTCLLDEQMFQYIYRKQKLFSLSYMFQGVILIKTKIVVELTKKLLNKMLPINIKHLYSRQAQYQCVLSREKVKVFITLGPILHKYRFKYKTTEKYKSNVLINTNRN